MRTAVMYAVVIFIKRFLEFEISRRNAIMKRRTANAQGFMPSARPVNSMRGRIAVHAMLLPSSGINGSVSF